MSETAYRAVFFDLDGTLLPMDLDEFMKAYMGGIARYVAGSGRDVDTFNKGLMSGIKAMAGHDDGALNSEVFWEAFLPIAGDTYDDWKPLLDVFYEKDFGEIGDNVEPGIFSRHVTEVLSNKGYPLLLTTMPMFPLRAVEWRLGWAGVNPRKFKRITHYENSTSVKPKLAYFEENLKAAGVKPEEVLMVGNNTKEDLCCLELGMDAYLITDHLLNPNDFDINTVKHGTFAEFAQWIMDLPICENPATDIETGPLSGR